MPDLPPSSSSPLGDALAADAVVAQATDSPGHHGPVHTHCENCGTKLDGPFCHKCGQHDFDVHRSFGHMFLEALENIFHFDGKFFTNLVTLLFRPGRLTAAFNAGKRASQVPPFRLYIFTAFFFFFYVFSTTKTPDLVKMDLSPDRALNAGLTIDGQPATLEQVLKARNDPVYAEELKRKLAADLAQRGADAAEQGKHDSRAVDRLREFSDKLAAEARAKRAAEANQPHLSIKPLDKPAAEQTDLERWLEERGRHAMDPEVQREIAHAFIVALPKMMLFCLPFFALYTRVLFRKSGQVYLQHLITALHFHTFIFLWVMFRDGWVFLARFAGIGLQGWVQLACNAWLAVYPLLMLRRLFANSWPWTFAKTFTLALCYVVTLGAAFFVTAIILFVLL
ncbi:MAG: hypothetical protein C0518_03905 [Opitutus sp.]|nr:hypothetical protein [Opitutus sp.]